MSMSGFVRFTSRIRSSNQITRILSTSEATFSKHNKPGATTPFLQHYRSTWPNTAHELPPDVEEPVLPPRTIDDKVLHFKLSARYDFGSSVFYPNLDYHPADFKVSMMVKTADLGLNEEELKIFLHMVGPRYNQGKREVKLTCKRFPNRIENKRFLVLTLENLLAEAKNLSSLTGVQKYEE
mmetsp:Transcript_835/g.1445  ORF Transcript_835/g.1445 Transcript_835/m.1445 type:complete len:181 (-) Transcript_835:276-818(-)